MAAGVSRAGHVRRSSSEVERLITLSEDPDANVRKTAVKNLCPCHVRANFPPAWDRILEMVADPSPLVRRAVVHLLADGSPRHRADEVVSALEGLRYDSDRVVRKQVARVLTAHRRTGRVNTL
jgi:HEAT repeat protein